MNPVLFSFTLKHGLILCPVVLYHEGESVVARHMVVDTGASHSIIHPDLVDALNIRHTGSESIHTITVAGIISFPKVTIQQIGIHQANIHNVDVLVGALPQELAITGILGYSFLKHFIMTVNYPKQEIMLEQVSGA